MMKKIIIGIVLLVIGFFGGSVVTDAPVGSGSGQDHYNHEFFLDGLDAKKFTQGGDVLVETPTGATHTLTEADLLNSKIITFTASTTMPALTLTLPATSTLVNLLPDAGDSREWLIENPFTGAATTTTIAAGTGIDLQEPDGQNVVIGIDNYALLNCFREVSSDVVCTVDEHIPAD